MAVGVKNSIITRQEFGLRGKQYKDANKDFKSKRGTSYLSSGLLESNFLDEFLHCTLVSVMRFSFFSSKTLLIHLTAARAPTEVFCFSLSLRPSNSWTNVVTNTIQIVAYGINPNPVNPLFNQQAPPLCWCLLPDIALWVK